MIHRLVRQHRALGHIPPQLTIRERGAYIGSPRLGGSSFYLNLFLGSQALQVALNVEQDGIQHVKDPENQGAV